MIRDQKVRMCTIAETEAIAEAGQEEGGEEEEEGGGGGGGDEENAPCAARPIFRTASPVGRRLASEMRGRRCEKFRA